MREVERGLVDGYRDGSDAVPDPRAPRGEAYKVSAGLWVFN